MLYHLTDAFSAEFYAFVFIIIDGPAGVHEHSNHREDE